jgi:hypothetical protein
MAKSKLIEDGFRLSAAATFLWADAAAVIWLRSWLLLSQGPGAREEALRMISEKFGANADLAVKFAHAVPLSPQEAAKLSLSHYGSRVRANRKRLALRS